MKFALSGAHIFDGFQIKKDAALLVENDRIAGIVPNSEVPDGFEIKNLEAGLLTPGFIDLQINGAGGVLFNNAPTVKTLKTMSNAMLPYGVTQILPTVITDDPAVTEAAVEAALDGKDSILGILGIHVEGPFFSEKKNGVHKVSKIRKLNEQDWRWLKKMATIPSLLTLAPEQVESTDLETLSSMGIRLCAGHTNSKYGDVINAHQHGLTGFTHLFNAMRPMTGREPGVVGAAMALKETWAGIIADGIHVHDASLKLAIGTKGADKIFLVSDAMATAGSNQRWFELYGERIELHEDRLVNSEGKLAGSAITLLDAIHYCLKTLRLPTETVLAMASRVPAEYMKVDETYGTFTSKSMADICLLDTEFNVRCVWQSGKEIQ